VPERDCCGDVTGVDGKEYAERLAGICKEKRCCGMSMAEGGHVDSDDNRTGQTG